MAEDIFVPGKFTDLSKEAPQQLAQLNDLLYDMLARLNQIDTGSIVLSWLEGDTAGQVIASAGVGNSPVWAASPTLTGLTLSGLTASQLVVTNGSKALASSISPLITNYYGSMYQYNASTLIAVDAADTWYDVTSMTTGSLNGFTFTNTHELTCGTAGKYLASWSMSISVGSANKSFEGGILIGGAIQQQTAGHVVIGSTNSEHSLSGHGIITLAATNVVTLGVLNHTDTTDVTVEHANVALVRVGA